MAIANSNQRITITVSKEMAERLDLYSKKMGVNRSALCAQFIGVSIMGYDKAFDVMDNFGKDMIAETVEKK